MQTRAAMRAQRVMNLLGLIVLLCLPHVAQAGQPPEGRTLTQEGSMVVPLFAQVATTGNINLSNPGTSTFDGVTLSASDDEELRWVLVWQQTTQSQNGLYRFNGSSSAMTRSQAADNSFDLKPGLPIVVIRGNTYARNLFLLNIPDYPIVGTTALPFLRASTAGQVSAVQSLTASSQIDCGANDVPSRTVRIRSASVGTGVTLTSTPQILAGSDGQRCVLRGEDNDESVTLVDNDETDGVILGGATSLLFTEGATREFQYIASLGEWVLMSGGTGTSTDDLQDVFARGTVIDTSTAATPFTIKDPSSAAKVVIYWSGGVPTFEFLGADGQPLDRSRNINSGKFDRITVNGSECERLTGAGVHSYSNVCRPWAKITFKPGALEFDETPTTGCAAPTSAVINSGPKVQYWQCADNDAATTYGHIPMDDSGWDASPIKFTLYANHAVDEDLTCTLDFVTQCVSPGDTPLNVWSAVGTDTDVVITRTAAGNDPNDDLQASTGEITPAGSCAVGDTIYFKMVRVAAESGTNCANMRHKEIDLFFRKKTRNGAQE